MAAAPGDTLASDITYSEILKLLPSLGDAGDQFGQDADLNGSTLVIGAHKDDDNGEDSGSAYVFERDSGGNWIEVAKLLPADGHADAEFGDSVGTSGDWAVVGAAHDNDLGEDAGAAYIFHRHSGGRNNWGFFLKLLAEDGEEGDWFGESVAMRGDIVLVGARGDTVGSGDVNGQGSAYVFGRNAGGNDNWGQVAMLVAPDGAPDDNFGEHVALDRRLAVIGAPGSDDANQDAGAVYIFERSGDGRGGWTFLDKVLASDAQKADRLGNAVAISGDTLAVAAEDADMFESNQGAVYIFDRHAGGPDSWGAVAKLTAIDGGQSQNFGNSVDIEDDTLAVGMARGDITGGFSFTGAAYVFHRNEGGPDAWGKIAKLSASDGDEGDSLGLAVNLSGGMLVVTAAGDEDPTGENSGSAYLFEKGLIDPAVDVTGDCPGEITFTFTGGTPLGQAALAYSAGIGSGPIPGGLCGGTETGLDFPELLGILPVDANGEITSELTVLEQAVCELQLQAIDMVACAPSNVTTLP